MLLLKDIFALFVDKFLPSDVQDLDDYQTTLQTLIKAGCQIN